MMAADRVFVKRIVVELQDGDASQCGWPSLVVTVAICVKKKEA